MRAPRNILISIHPRHAGRIYAGTKSFEYRRRASGLLERDRLLIYETAPISKITGEARIEEVQAGSSHELSMLESDCTERKLVARYLAGARRPVALKLVQIVKYKSGKSLKEFGLRYPPRTYQFLEI